MGIRYCASSGGCAFSELGSLPWSCSWNQVLIWVPLGSGPCPPSTLPSQWMVPSNVTISLSCCVAEWMWTSALEFSSCALGQVISFPFDSVFLSVPWDLQSPPPHWFYAAHLPVCFTPIIHFFSENSLSGLSCLPAVFGQWEALARGLCV